MIGEFFDILSQWSRLDTWIVITGVMAAMACALPGCFLLLRRQSMMGDALSHTSLLGVVVAYLATHLMKELGWIERGADAWLQHALMFFGAMGIGILAAVMTESIRQLGRVEASAALGVVFTVLFALGLLLVRLNADEIDLDPGCVLYGSVERAFSFTGVPDETVMNAIVWAINAILVIVFFKELRISAFDPGLATSLGINARWIHYGLMAITAGTVVAAFESVGVILVIAMLIAPAATAHLLTDRLGRLVVIAQLVAVISAVLGHVFAITLPKIVFSRLGYPQIEDASTAGMMAVVSGVFFAIAMVFAPRHGLLSRRWQQIRLGMRIAAEDLLGLLFRLEEHHISGNTRFASTVLHDSLGVSRVWTWVALRGLQFRGDLLILPDKQYQLTEQGRRIARRLVRSHRLWESYLQKHFTLPDDHLHHSAERVEHFIGSEVRDALSRELDSPDMDPHGKAIPSEADQAASQRRNDDDFTSRSGESE